jgi:CHAT domain-containing protein
MNYLDFEIELGAGQGREYPIVVRSLEGEARETMRFPFDELALENRLQTLQIALLRSGGERRRMLSAEEQAVQEFGRGLFDSLFTGDVRSLYDRIRRRAAHDDWGVRVKLRIRSPELAALPWEFLYDPRQNEYVCLSRNTPLIRYLELTQTVQPLTVKPPLRILGMVASPKDLAALDIEREKQRVKQATESLQAGGLVELHWLPGQTWRDLQRAMRRGPWHIFHFIGHGMYDKVTDQGMIALCDDYGDTQRLRAAEFATLLADHSPLRFVLLNACEGARSGGQDTFSSTASILVSRGIPAVLAMQYEITDRAAIEFARSFYEALTDGAPVDEAVVEARKSVRVAVANTVEWGTPALFMRSIDGVLFQFGRGETGPDRLGRAPEHTAPEKIELEEVGRPAQAQTEPEREKITDLQQTRSTPTSPDSVRPVNWASIFLKSLGWGAAWGLGWSLNWLVSLITLGIAIATLWGFQFSVAGFPNAVGQGLGLRPHAPMSLAPFIISITFAGLLGGGAGGTLASFLTLSMFRKMELLIGWKRIFFGALAWVIAASLTSLMLGVIFIGAGYVLRSPGHVSSSEEGLLFNGVFLLGVFGIGTASSWLTSQALRRANIAVRWPQFVGLVVIWGIGAVIATVVSLPLTLLFFSLVFST